jgi:3-mercaptopyruvate sulfurtransferase SseA
MGLVPEVMISPKTLNSWLTMGYGVDTFGYYRMVILAVDSKEGYRQGHIPGAFLLEDNSADLWSERSNGISVNSFQVPTRDQMDEIVRRANIDTDSIIIITGSSMTGIGRAYFNFRYWGFPRQQLKVLNGTTTTYGAAGFALQTENPPVPVPCQYSVCNTRNLSSFSAVRASLAEMIAQAEDSTAESTILDTRSSAEYAGTPGSTIVNRENNEYVTFEGHLKRAVNVDYKTLLVEQSPGNPLIPKEDLEKIMNRKNIDGKNISYVYGRNGQEDGVAYLALDAELNWPVKLYDGGWSQWGQMAGNSASQGGMLQEDSPWRTDMTTRSESITYNKPNGYPLATGGKYNSYAQQGDAISRSDLAVCGKTGENLKTVPPAPGY